MGEWNIPIALSPYADMALLLLLALALPPVAPGVGLPPMAPGVALPPMAPGVGLCGGGADPGLDRRASGPTLRGRCGFVLGRKLRRGLRLGLVLPHP